MKELQEWLQQDQVTQESETMIEWKEYPYNRDYLVSNDGKIVGKRGKTLKSYISTCGYVMHKINIGGRWVSKGLHRIVAETFIPNPLGLSDVDHVNGDKLDNRLDNLRWLSHKDNCSRNDFDKIADSIRKRIVKIDKSGNELKRYRSVVDAANELVRQGVTDNRHCAGNIISGIRKGLIRYGYYWKYLQKE